LNDELVSASAHQKLVHRGGGYVLEWDGVEALDGVLWPVARSAATLLTSALRSRVRICAAEDGCGWTFLDRSKNQSRRWCSMSDCGNRAKARRHYRRVRGLAPAR
jgi:predicted RNA-binding Zn ribbon-like protein